MIKFILNNETIATDLPPGTTLLDFVRYHRDLKGTKIGCREGDCGACTMLVGTMTNDEIVYRSVTSCITPIGNVYGKHAVTVEGINMNDLSPVQQALVDESGTQCGFCTPGFVISLTGCCLNKGVLDESKMIEAIDGNICRCTGYKSIERAASRINNLLSSRDNIKPLNWLVSNKFIPNYFEGIEQRLKEFQHDGPNDGEVVVGGGTDLYVQKHHETEASNIHFVNRNNSWGNIVVNGSRCTIGSTCTASDLMQSDVLLSFFPQLKNHLKLVSSTPIRNIGTLAGNFVNASPIGDLTAFFLALNCELTLVNRQGEQRSILLRDFYEGYKKLNKSDEENVSHIAFDLPDENSYFNFEKVSKRTYLDIASVNTAVLLRCQNNVIESAHLSAGGVAPIPLYLKKASSFLVGKKVGDAWMEELKAIIQSEISPISDVRGSEKYKRLLLNNLVFAHFVELFPDVFKKEVFA
jgi:xanthine dehydrogenase small subunit